MEAATENKAERKKRFANAAAKSLVTPLLTERLSRLRLTGQTARDVLAAVRDTEIWIRLLTIAEANEDVRTMLDALKFLTMMRDGRPAQTIAVTTTSVNVSPDDIKRAREIVRELIATSERTLAGNVTVIDATEVLQSQIENSPQSDARDAGNTEVTQNQSDAL